MGHHFFFRPAGRQPGRESLPTRARAASLRPRSPRREPTEAERVCEGAGDHPAEPEARWRALTGIVEPREEHLVDLGDLPRWYAG